VRRQVLVDLSVFLVGGIAAAHAQTANRPVDFNRDIRPILSDNCFACHGPDEKKQMAGLRLDLKEGAFAKKANYQIIVPGDPAGSRLFQRISAEKKAMRMPPPASERSLTDQQIALVRTWIEQGAKWDTHWAYSPPKRNEPPQVKASTWVRNPIDNFILARLERDGWKPSAEADKPTLLRRVTFDLTGLPPTPAETQAFLSDPSPKAYENVVDRLLSSPRYGERMALPWLDLARYADTHGYHIDSHRDMWHWRDWVIQAFNNNLPYDQFTVQQLAGDLLPGATLQQKIATGFNRNHMINFEGGAIPEEYQAEYMVDRVEATSVVWMGMTMGCARCHDHKYDPIKQKEFYQFGAFFNTIPEKGLDGRKGNAEPYVQLPSDEQAGRLKQVTADLSAKQKALKDADVPNVQATWEKIALDQLPEAPRNGMVAHYEMDGNIADSSGRYRHGRVLAGDPTFGAGAVGKEASFDGQTQVDFGEMPALDGTAPFSIALWVKSGDIHAMPILQKMTEGSDRRGIELLWNESYPIGNLRRGATLSARLIHRSPDEAIEIRTREPLPSSSKEEGALKPVYQVTLVYDGSGKASGLLMYINGKLEPAIVVNDKLNGTIQSPGHLQVGNKKLGDAFKGQIDDLRIYDRKLSPAEVDQLAFHQPARATLFLTNANRSKDQKTRLTDYFLTRVAPEPLRKLDADLKTLRAQKMELDSEIPTSMVMAEMEKPRETAVLGRGDYRNRGEKVNPGVPATLPPLPQGAPRNRLTLAKWLVDPAHPLTARVAVNRYWQMYFGNGIVKTAEDFGSQGEAPSHPELLDWLATEFVRTGWDVKAMQRLIVTSATYRQNSRVTPELREKDPENRLLARGPRFRLQAEMVRDNALAVSGLLNERVGGASVFPYQPKGLWEDIAFGDVYSAQSYTPSHGKDLYRRSMYSFWKRTSGPPSLLTFDAPDREKCTARRSVTNTPLQALVLLNDPSYIEASRALAQRIMTEAGGDAAKRIEYGFRLVTARKPSAKEAKILLDLERQELSQYRRNKDAAMKLLAVGESAYDKKLDPTELAAWTTVASTMLNMDEAITKE
jgi:hypothetical protein